MTFLNVGTVFPLCADAKTAALTETKQFFAYIPMND